MGNLNSSSSKAFELHPSGRGGLIGDQERRFHCPVDALSPFEASMGVCVFDPKRRRVEIALDHTLISGADRLNWRDRIERSGNGEHGVGCAIVGFGGIRIGPKQELYRKDVGVRVLLAGYVHEQGNEWKIDVAYADAPLVQVGTTPECLDARVAKGRSCGIESRFIVDPSVNEAIEHRARTPTHGNQIRWRRAHAFRRISEGRNKGGACEEHSRAKARERDRFRQFGMAGSRAIDHINRW